MAPLLRETPDLVLLELPELEQGVLGALVRRRLQQVAVDLGRQRGLLQKIDQIDAWILM